VKESLRIGWNSVKVNRVPMLVLWALAASLAFAYYRLPGFAELLAPVKDWQARNGAVAAFATQFFFCGVLPAVFLSVVSEIKTEHHLLKCVLQSVWSGSWGIVYLWFYALQTRMFGGGHDIATLVAKTAFDEFVWAPFTSVPLTSLFFLWMGSGFSVSRAARTCREGFFRRVALPTLFSNWAVWIPAVMAVYAFPLDLQIFMLGLVSCFWTLVCLQLGKRANGKEDEVA
jgi:hypothetical protein